MPTRRQSAQEPPVQPRLMLPADRLDAAIAERLALGQELLDRSINDPADFEEAQNEYYSWDEYNETLLKTSFDTEAVYEAYRSVAMGWPTDRPLPTRVGWLRRDVSEKMRRIRSVKDQLGLYQLSPKAEVSTVQSTLSSLVGTEIFIVHGHDEETKSLVARFLARLVGREPLILQEQPDRGRTIIEKFEYHAAQAACAVVLLTDDDLGGAKSGEQQPRARQNVVLELGFFIGKLGRERVIILYKPGVEVPSDLHGVLYTEVDNLGAWHKAVARELEDIGMQIDYRALLRL